MCRRRDWLLLRRGYWRGRGSPDWRRLAAGRRWRPLLLHPLLSALAGLFLGSDPALAGLFLGSGSGEEIGDQAPGHLILTSLQVILQGRDDFRRWLGHAGQPAGSGVADVEIRIVHAGEEDILPAFRPESRDLQQGLLPDGDIGVQAGVKQHFAALRFWQSCAGAHREQARFRRFGCHQGLDVLRGQFLASAGDDRRGHLPDWR